MAKLVDPNTLKSIDVKYATVGGSTMQVMTDPTQPMQLAISQQNPIPSLAQLIGGVAVQLQAVLREVVDLRERVSRLEGVDVPPYVDTPEELAPPPVGKAASPLLTST